MTRYVLRHLARIASSFDRRRVDRELAEELRAHIELHIEDNVQAGMTPALARRDALIKLGGVQQSIEQCRDTCWVRWVAKLVD